MIQQREIDAARPNDDILLNCVHPGYVDTGSSINGIISKYIVLNLPNFLDMTSHKGPFTIDEGAVAATWLAMLPQNAKSPRGGFVWHDKTVVDWVNGPFPG